MDMAGMNILLIARKRVQIRLMDVSACHVKPNIGNANGNKGAVMIRFELEDTTFVFINHHLCSGVTKV